MVGRTNIKTDYRNIFGNETRIKIWSLCKKKPRSFTEIKNLLKISSGSLSHHFELMERAELLKKEEIKTKGKFEIGKRIKVIANMEKFNELFNAEKKSSREFFNNRFPHKLKIELLNLLKQNEPISKFNFYKLLIEKGKTIETLDFLTPHLIYDGKIEEIYKLTKEGEQFLQDNKKLN